MLEYSIARAALVDMNNIEEYYLSVAGERVARRVLGRIHARFQLIAEHPYIGVARPEYGEEIRIYRLPNTPYIIAYTVSGGMVEITRVVHGRRNLGRLFG